MALVVLTTLLRSSSGARQRKQTERKLKEMSAFVEEEDTSESTYDGSFVMDTSDRSETCENLEVTSNEEEPDMPVPPVIWTYWEQGWTHAPLVCQICIESWELSNPELTLHKVSASDLPALLPDLCRWDRLWELPAGQRSSCEISSSQEVRWHLGGCDPVQQCPNHAMVGRIEAIKKTALPNRTK